MKYLILLVLVFAVLLSVYGCIDFQEATDSELGTKVDSADIQTEENIHLRDKNLLYGQYDNTEIVTMYLTVSTGNAGE